jgi:phospholipid/cholesterol/gamma-HCH transport system permease protein
MEPGRPVAEIDRSGEAVILKVGGIWRLTQDLPRLVELIQRQPVSRQIRAVPQELIEWDSSLPLFLLHLRSWCREHDASLNLDELPESLKKLLDLIQESEESAAPPKSPKSLDHAAARLTRRAAAGLKNSVQFVGECAIGAIETPTDPRQFRWRDFFVEMVQAGPKALPIVGLLSFLIGVVFAYETATQLRQFGAQIYVINGLGVAVARQIGPILAAVILAGRTGAAFAAHIGNMKLGGEIDALEVLGVSPVTFLVLPRLAALFCMMPLITLYSDLFGLLGGFMVTISITNIPATEFWVKMQTAVSLTDVIVGLVKGVVFGVLIGLAGTLRGLQCERSSAGVGRAATSAVVTGITAIIVADTLFAPILDKLGF